MKKAVEEDRIILHDLRGVNVKVDFFLDINTPLYPITWQGVNVRVELCTFIEQISELDFFFSSKLLFIDDHLISGDVIDFDCKVGAGGILYATCKIIINWD
jgi:hypothetical protein